MFGSQTLLGHLLRGALGMASLTLAVQLGNWWALPLAGLALWMFRGCPMCWTVGLFETIARAVHRRHEGITRSPGDPSCRGCR